MAKRKKTKEERKAAKHRATTGKLLRRYARHCYQLARRDEAKLKGLPVSAIVPTKRGFRHSDVEKVAERKIVEWFDGLPEWSRGRALDKIRAELDRRLV